MKLLVSTTQTQGRRANDFCFLPEGEIVYPSFVCDSGHVDDRCGCRRALAGFTTHKASTTFRVADVAIDETQLHRIVKDGLTAAGWNPSTRTVESVAADLLVLAEDWPVGTVVEYRDGVVQPR